MSPDQPVVIDRREALRRAALVLGGALSAPLVGGVLAGCEARRVAADVWQPRALTPDQAELVAAIAEHILPETDTPGARAVGVHRFIDALLAESYPATERAAFVAGLADVDARAQRVSGGSFLRATPARQLALLEQLDREAFGASAPVPLSTSTASPPVPLSATRRGGTPYEPKVPFFRTIKELTLVGYYTSEVGATRELHHAPVPGRFEGCVPLAQIGRTWAV